MTLLDEVIGVALGAHSGSTAGLGSLRLTEANVGLGIERLEVGKPPRSEVTRRVQLELKRHSTQPFFRKLLRSTGSYDCRVSILLAKDLRVSKNDATSQGRSQKS